MTTAVQAEPLHRTAPAWHHTNGDIAAGVGQDLGLAPDTEQQWLLDQIYGETADGMPSAPEVAVVAPRQNLKSAALEIAALMDLFVVGVELAVWTAHEFKTARKSFEDMRRRILRNPEYAARAEFRDSHGEEAIFLDTGERLEFHARSGGSGRGFTCQRLTLDEWMYGQEGDLGALAPTMFTIPDAQIRYASSAGKVKSAALRQIRERGRQGDPALAYVEYGAERRACAEPLCTHLVGTPGCALDDRELWWQANCALWAGRASEAAVEKQRRMLPPREFMREFLSWWEDPPNLAGGDLDADLWLSLEDAQAERGRDVTFGVDVDEDRVASIAVTWPRPDGGYAMLDPEPVPAHRLAERCKELVDRWGGMVAAPTSLVEDLRRAGVRVVEIKPSMWSLASSAFVDALAKKAIRHGNQPRLNDAVRIAKFNPTSAAGTKSFRLKDSGGAGPLFAVCRALYAMQADAPSVYEERGFVTL